MFKDKFKEIAKKHEGNNKKKIENIVFLVIVLIITVFIIDTIWKGDKASSQENSTNTSNDKVLAGIIDNNEQNVASNDSESKLANILSTIKGVGKVNVFINYSQSSSVVPIYDETTTTSSTSETDSSGGVRNVTETQTQKDVTFTESGSEKQIATEKTVMPKIEGAIVTAEGASDIAVKTNIINAVEAVTGLTIDKVQVFEMK